MSSINRLHNIHGPVYMSRTRAQRARASSRAPIVTSNLLALNGYPFDASFDASIWTWKNALRGVQLWQSPTNFEFQWVQTISKRCKVVFRKGTRLHY